MSKKPGAAHYVQQEEIMSLNNLKANLSFWHMGLVAKIDGAVNSENHYAYFRVRYIKKTIQLQDDDSKRAKLKNIPEGARYYLYKIHKGYSYEEVVWGDRHHLNLDVASGFVAGSITADVVKKDHHAHWEIHSRGLRLADGKTITVDTLKDFQNSFVYNKNAPSVAVLLEFRPIEEGNTNPDVPINWGRKVLPQVTTITVVKNGVMTVGSSAWKLEVDCGILGDSRKKDHLSPDFSGDVNDGETYTISMTGSYFWMYPKDKLVCQASGVSERGISKKNVLGTATVTCELDDKSDKTKCESRLGKRGHTEYGITLKAEVIQ